MVKTTALLIVLLVSACAAPSSRQVVTSWKASLPVMGEVVFE